MPPPAKALPFKTQEAFKMDGYLTRASRQTEINFWVAFFTSIVTLIPLSAAFRERQYQEGIVCIFISLALVLIARRCAREKKQLRLAWEELVRMESKS